MVYIIGGKLIKETNNIFIFIGGQKCSPLFIYINEFTKLFREHIEDNNIVIDIYDELCDTDLVKEIE